MKKWMSILLAIALLAACGAAPAETAAAVPTFLTPRMFTEGFNSLMEALADQYAAAGKLNEQTVGILKKNFMFNKTDSSDSILYFGTDAWFIEAAFYYPDNPDANDSTPAQTLNLAIRNDTPSTAATFAKRIFALIVGYEFQGSVSQQELNDWFGTEEDPSNVFVLPGYIITAFRTDTYMQYAILPENAQNPLEGAEPAQGAYEDPEEWMDIRCEEEGFTTKKPTHALYQYIDRKGYIGLALYLDVPGGAPYVLIHRRAADKKFSNPENYLNNVFREFLEDSYTNGSVATTQAKTMEVGGKKLIGARYTSRSDDGTFVCVEVRLIEQRELGDVEYSIIFFPEEEEAAMKALDAAVACYREDEAQAAAGRDSGTQLTDKDLELLKVQINGEEYILGQSTPQDLVKNGWTVTRESDGTFSVSTDWGIEGIYINTANGKMDEPILTINAMWIEGTVFKYNGFDGIIGIEIDGDDTWYPGGMTDEKMRELVGDEGACGGLWDSLRNWLETECGGTEDEDGITNAVITLSNGQKVYVSTHDSPPRISLTGF